MQHHDETEKTEHSAHRLDRAIYERACEMVPNHRDFSYEITRTLLHEGVSCVAVTLYIDGTRHEQIFKAP